jgi:hypothetical protein
LLGSDAFNAAEKRAPEILASDRESASRLTLDGNWWHPEDIVAGGAAADFGVGAFITNAHNVRELKDEFDPLIVDVGPIELQVGKSGDSWIASLTGVLGMVTIMQTNTTYWKQLFLNRCVCQ